MAIVKTGVDTQRASLLARHEFLLRRLHSLSGLVPVGAYMVVHLLTNASVLDSAATFQRNVYQIHSLGRLLPFLEWGFIFIPILFHAILGVVIIRGGLPNSGTYAYPRNIRYTLQRATGMVAFVFIVWHVFHMHGWFHFDPWLSSVAEPLAGAKFKAYNAATSAATAIQGRSSLDANDTSLLIVLLYAIGVLACVFHLANGVWTMGITWGVWVSPAAQRRASWCCCLFGVALAAVGLGALTGFWSMGPDQLQQARQLEDQMYESKRASGQITADSYKRAERAQGE